MVLTQYFIAIFKDESLIIRIERNEEEDKFFFISEKGVTKFLKKTGISDEFKQKFPTNEELRFKLLFRTKLNDNYKTNDIKFINIGGEDKMGYDEIKEEIKEQITYNIPFNSNEKINLLKDKIIYINRIRFMNIKTLVLNKVGLQLYSDPNSIISDFISIKNITSFKIDDTDRNSIKYIGDDKKHNDLYVSKSLNDLLNRFDLETDKEVLPVDKAIQWFKDLGYNLNVFEEDNDDLDYHYEGIFEIPSFDDDTVNDKLYEAHKLELEVLNLLKHF